MNQELYWIATVRKFWKNEITGPLEITQHNTYPAYLVRAKTISEAYNKLIDFDPKAEVIKIEQNWAVFI